MDSLMPPALISTVAITTLSLMKGVGNCMESFCHGDAMFTLVSLKASCHQVIFFKVE